MIVELSKSVALLLSLCLVQDFILRHWRNGETLGQVVSGMTFGGICVIGMSTPIDIAPGVIFDARSVILSMSGLFGGPLVGGISALMAGGYRAWLGGGGAPVGVAVVISCVTLGLLFRYAHQRGWVRIGALQLLVFGLVVHLVEIYLFTFLPAEIVTRVMQEVALPLVLTFTPGTAMLGLLLLAVESQTRMEHSLAESERRFKDFAEASSDWFWEMDADLRFTYGSDRLFQILGVGPEVALGRKREDLVDASQRNSSKWKRHLDQLNTRRPFKNFEYAIPNAQGRHPAFLSQRIADS
ncbi:MAG: LytS/YhcK type 5TM receptor domain-containing protein [Paracoccaceae bacterium]|nr:LytS/YhcK type 5TM receptor domain-containing protein [Paracoccaceae bacterium]